MREDPEKSVATFQTSFPDIPQQRLSDRGKASLLAVVATPVFEFDPAFLEKSEPYGWFSVDGRQLELHHGLLVERQGSKVIGIWKNPTIDRLCEVMLSSNDDAKSIGEMLQVLEEQAVPSTP